MPCALNSDFEKFGFDQTVSAFAMWSAGLGLAVCCLAGEMVHRMVQQHSRENEMKVQQHSKHGEMGHKMVQRHSRENEITLSQLKLQLKRLKTETASAHSKQNQKQNSKPVYINELDSFIFRYSE